MPTKTESTSENKHRFIEAIRRGMKVGQAARYAHVDRTTPYDWESNDTTFAVAWTEARAARDRMIVDTAVEVALSGNVPMLKFLLQFKASRHQQPQPMEIHIIPQEATPDATAKPFFTRTP